MGPLAGLRVLDLSPNRVGAQVSQLFADFGADVIQVEPPGGVAIRRHASFAFWARGKRSIVLDLARPADREVLRELLREADVLVETFQPGALDELGLSHEALSTDNPRLIHVSVTGFGRQGPNTDVPGYEGTVLATLGALHSTRAMNRGERPAFITSPFASFAASQLALHGVLAALYERERTGKGQLVETSLLQAFTALDTWAWFEHLISVRWPDAYPKVGNFDANGTPGSPLMFMLLVALTSDGAWLQFASVAPHLFAAKMKALGLDWMFADDDWKGLPIFADPAKRKLFWEKMLEAAQAKSLREWNDIFEQDPNLFAEQFRSGEGILAHPQLVHDRMVVDVEDHERGPVRQPGAIVKATSTPAELGRSAPRCDEHRAEILAAGWGDPNDPAVSVEADVSAGLPLDGVTILELATLFAAPHGTTVLTDLGARVIKVEPLAGDRIRSIIPFPESGGAKVMQGKESICVDLSTDEGVQLVRDIAARVDVVIQGYRAGSMAKLGLDYQAVRQRNPDVIYVNAPGYGVDGPYGSRPAYAPSIGAAAGIPLTNLGQTLEQRAGLSIDEIEDGARRLWAAGTPANAQADGVAALGVATAILFGLVARSKGTGGQELLSSMLNTNAHCMSAHAVTYPGAPVEPGPDPELRGLGPTYRIYDASSGHVFLAACSEAEWVRLARALRPFVDLAGDDRFRDRASREANASALVDVLTGVFAGRAAKEWHDELLAQGVACVEVFEGSIEERLFDDSFGRASGYVADVVHPTFDEHPRLAPYLRFSRSQTQALPGVLAGQHTDPVLRWLGRTAGEIADLRERGIIG